MRELVSGIVHGLSWAAAFFTVIATSEWASIIRNHDGLDGMGFAFFVTPVLGGGSLLFGVLPSWLLYCRGRERRDWVSLWLSAGSFLVVLGEMIVLCVVPLHGC